MTEKKKKLLFEEYDRISIDVLSLTSDAASTFLEQFVPVRWWGRTFNALAYLPSFKMILKKRKLENSNPKTNRKNNSSPSQQRLAIYDALYVATDKNRELLVFYITPHLIYTHIDSGKCTLDILHQSQLKYQSVAVSPKYKFRTFDNKSVEFIVCREDSMKLKSKTHPSLGMFCEKECSRSDNDYKILSERLLCQYLQFIDNVHDFFSRTLYLPYMVHPYRLILFEEEELRLVSCNLMQYVFHPYASLRKIVDVHFSHPFAFPHFYREGYGATEMLTRNSVMLVLDFLHSAFFTALWICRPAAEISRNDTYNNSQWDYYHQTELERFEEEDEEEQQRKEDPFFGNIHFPSEAKIITTPTTTLTSTTTMTKKCRNPSGYCYSYNKSDLVHDYGCGHLLSLAPSILISAVNAASDKQDKTLFIDCVSKEILLLKHFISEIIKNSNYERRSTIA